MKSLMGNILYLSHDGLTDPLGQSQVLPYIVGLANRGYSFTVISFEKRDNFLSASKKVTAECSRYEVDWIPLPYHNEPPILSTLFDLLRLKHKVEKLHQVKKFDLVHCRSYITSIVGLWLKRKHNVGFVFDMRGFWADERVDGGLWNMRNPFFKAIYSFFKRKEHQFLKGSDAVITLTNNAKKELLSWHIKTPISVIPCCVDTEHFDPAKVTEEQKQNLLLKLGLKPADLVILYLGSWGTWYETDEMLEFFSEVKLHHSNAKFLIVTMDKVDLTSYEHEQDVVIVKAARQEVPVFVSIATASVFFIKPTFSKKASSATKMGEILAMNVPVITNKGWGDVDELCYQSLVSFRGNLKLAGLNLSSPLDTRVFCLAELSLVKGIEKYASVYCDLLKER